jgi:hypothetical protein
VVLIDLSATSVVLIGLSATGVVLKTHSKTQ